MKGYSLSRKLGALAIPALLSLTALPAKAAVHDHNLVPFLGDVRGPTCSATDPTVGIITAETPLDTPLFNRTFRGGLGSPACSPVLDPNGNQLPVLGSDDIPVNHQSGCRSQCRFEIFGIHAL